MYNFKTFIAESGDTSYEFHKSQPPKKPVWADESHRYAFKDSSGAEKHVDIHNQSIHDKPGAEISFHDSNKEVNDSKYNATGQSGSKAVKIFSTVKAIMKHHAKAYPNIDYYVFDASHKEPSRVKLYSRMTKHLGGTTEKQTSTTRYKVQTNKLK
jgi:hypothetical protein